VRTDCGLGWLADDLIPVEVEAGNNLLYWINLFPARELQNLREQKGRGKVRLRNPSLTVFPPLTGRFCRRI